MNPLSNKRLTSYCELLSVLTLFAAIAYGLGFKIVNICYEMGKDDSPTFIWYALLEALEGYAIFFIGILTWVLARNVSKGRVFCRQNQRILSAMGVSTMLSGVFINVTIHLSPLEVSTGTSILLIIIGLVLYLIALLFEIGIRMQEEQELTV